MEHIYIKNINDIKIGYLILSKNGNVGYIKNIDKYYIYHSWYNHKNCLNPITFTYLTSFAMIEDNLSSKWWKILSYGSLL